MVFPKILAFSLAILIAPSCWANVDVLAPPIQQIESPSIQNFEAGDECDATISRNPVREAIRRTLISTHADLRFATEEENLAWIKMALTPKQDNKTYLILEASLLKLLNDVKIKNRVLVSAMINRYFELFTAELTKQMPDIAPKVTLETMPYFDFKSYRLIVQHSFSQSELARMQKIFASTNQQFYEDPRLKEIVRPDDLKLSWFRLALGRNVEEGSLVARLSRSLKNRDAIAYYWNPHVLKALKAKFQNFHNLHKQILADLPAMETNPVLALEIFTAARKAKAGDELVANLHKSHPELQVTTDQGLQIYRYVDLAGFFSPSLLIAKRETLTIQDAPFGAIAIDFIGLGAENLAATAEALAKAETLDDALITIREGERRVTQDFLDRQELVRKTILDFFAGQVSVRFSGDDGVALPEREFLPRDQLFLMQRLTALIPRSYFRITIISAQADASQMVPLGDNIEKKLRVLLKGYAANRLLRDANFQILINDQAAWRQAHLVIGISRKLTEVEKDLLRNLFPDAVHAINDELKNEGDNVPFEPMYLFYIGGRKN